MRFFLATFAALTFVSAGLAQPARAPRLAPTPEHLLPADCLAYFRYDGHEMHRKAYDQTALGEAMKEGLSDFFDHVFERLAVLAGGDVSALDPKQAPRSNEIERFLECVSKHGFAFALEVAPPRYGQPRGGGPYQITIVFPEGAQQKNREAIDKALHLAAGALGATVQATKFGGRPGYAASLGDIEAAWWSEGKHLLLTLGTAPAKRSLDVIEGRRANLTDAAWYRELSTFNRYETDIRGRVDLAAAIDWLAVVGLDSPRFDNFKDHLSRQLLLRHLGLSGVKDLTFCLGFDGKYQRSTVRLGVVEPKKRTGLLDLVTGPVAFEPDKLPPLPPNADYVSARHVDWNSVDAYIRTSFGLLAVSRLFESGEWPDRFPDLDRMVDGSFRKDFLEQLDTTLVTWGAHSEGPFLLGQGFAVKVKDSAKVRKSLDGIAKGLGRATEVLVSDKKMVRGHEMQVFSKLFPPMTYTLHNDWLVFGLFPQPVQGFLMRSGGRFRTWKAPPELAEALAKERKENGQGKLLAVTVSDPRPAIEMGLALLPAWIQGLNLSMGMHLLDVDKIPNAQAINEWAFPNVTLFYDDGNALRWERHFSLHEPDDLLLSASAMGMLNFIPVQVYRNPKIRGGDKNEVPRKIPEPFRPEPLQVEPTMCPATAEEKDGVVRIWVTVSRQVVETVMKKVTVMREKDVVQSGVTRKIAYIVTEDVPYTVTRTVMESVPHIADGKTLQVTRKDGKIVEPKDLPRLLEKQTQVLYVASGTVSAERLQALDDRTLIIRVLPYGPPATVPRPAFPGN